MNKKAERERRVPIHPCLDRRPIPPTWRRVVPSAGALAIRVDPPQEQSLDVVKR